jgi:hypothetical protein
MAVDGRGKVERIGVREDSREDLTEDRKENRIVMDPYMRERKGRVNGDQRRRLTLGQEDLHAPIEGEETEQNGDGSTGEEEKGWVNGGQRTRSTLGGKPSTHRPTVITSDVAFSEWDTSGSSDEDSQTVTNYFVSIAPIDCCHPLTLSGTAPLPRCDRGVAEKEAALHAAPSDRR